MSSFVLSFYLFLSINDLFLFFFALICVIGYSFVNYSLKKYKNIVKCVLDSNYLVIKKTERNSIK